jgi:putative SOS response-associated peptidase YedK
VCGRYVLASPGEVIAEHFRLAAVPVYPPRYNIAPTDQVLVVRETPAGVREAVLLRRSCRSARGSTASATTIPSCSRPRPNP